MAMQFYHANTVTLGKDSTISLAGFVAAVLRLDDRQGRIGGQTALVRRGNRPASAVTAPPMLPKLPYHPVAERITPHEAERLVAAVRKNESGVFAKEDCEADALSRKPQVYALGPQHALIFVECLRGAYQSSALGFISARSNGSDVPLKLTTPYLGGTQEEWETNLFTTPSFDPKTGTLDVFAKGRGVADCGYYAGWIWNGHAFALYKLSRQEACGGVAPGDWPALFRSTH